MIVTDDIKLLIQRPGEIFFAAMEGQLVNCYFACFTIGSEISQDEKISG